MKGTAIILAVIVVGLAGAVTYLQREIRAGRDQQALLETQIADLQKHDLQKQLNLARQEPPAPASVVADNAPAPAPVTSVRVPAPNVDPRSLEARADRMRQALAQQQAQLRNPEYRAAMRIQHKLMLRRNHSDVGAALNMNREQVEALFDLLAEQQLASMEDAQLARSALDPANPDSLKEWQARQQERVESREREVAALLGDAGLQAWKDYQASLPARAYVRDLRAALDGSTTPLRDDQFQPLVSVFTTVQRKHAEEMQAQRKPLALRAPDSTTRLAMMNGNLERTERHNRELLDAASPHLSARQREQLDQLLEQRLESMRASLTLMSSQGGVMIATDAISAAPYFSTGSLAGQTVVAAP